MKRRILACLALCCATLAHAGWFDSISFEVTKTQPPKGSEDGVLYMTSNGFTQDERYFVFGRGAFKAPVGKGTKPIGIMSESQEPYRRDMTTGEVVRLLPESMKANAQKAVVGGNSAFVITEGKDQAVYEIDAVKLGEPKLIWKFPAPVRGKVPYSTMPLSTTLDGNTVIVAFLEDIPVRGADLSERRRARMFNGAHAFMYIGKRTETGWDFRMLWDQADISKGWVSHLQLNPQTGKDVYFEIDGDPEFVEQRGWMIDVETGKISKVYPEPSKETLTSHGNYVKDGLIQIQEYHKKQCGSTFSDAILVHTKTDQIEKLPLDCHMHLQVFEKDGTYFIFGDGSWKTFNMVRYIFKDGKQVDSTIVTSHGRNTAYEEYHQHARLSPSGKWLVFGSSEENGDGSVMFVKDPLKLK